MKKHQVIPQGLFYFDNVITLEQAKDIVRKIDKDIWTCITPSLNSRKVQQYGYNYNYTKSNVDMEIAQPMPEHIVGLRDILTNKCKELNIINDDYVFDQCIINNYEIGQGISSHIDSLAFGDVIGCFTFENGAIMKFTKNNEIFNQYVKPKSLYIMSGDSRYVYHHAMPQTLKDTFEGMTRHRGRRISVTFRCVLN